MFAGVLSSSRATCPNTEMCRRDRRWDCDILLLHPFNGPLSRTTWVSRYQKGKTNLDFTEARDSEWQWHQLGHMQVCTSLQADNHASTPPLSFLKAGCPSCYPTDSVKELKAHKPIDLQNSPQINRWIHEMVNCIQSVHIESSELLSCVHTKLRYATRMQRSGRTLTHPELVLGVTSQLRDFVRQLIAVVNSEEAMSLQQNSRLFSFTNKHATFNKFQHKRISNFRCLIVYACIDY